MQFKREREIDMDGMLIITIVGVAITALGLGAAGLWAYNEAVKKQFESMQERADQFAQIIFRRLDDNKKSYWENFVTKEIHKLEVENIKERYDSNFKHLSEKIDALTDMIKTVIKTNTGG